MSLTTQSETGKTVSAKSILQLMRGLRSLPAPPKLLPFSGKRNKSHKDTTENGKTMLLLPEMTLVEVPKGFLAVYVGPEMRRFVIPASYLRLPSFKVLLDRVAEDFGFEHEGGLTIPCEEEAFEEILRTSKQNSKSRKKFIL